MSATDALMAFDPNRDWDTYRAAMRITCPWCKARPHHPCHTNGAPLRYGDRIHPSRASRSHTEGPT